jgi:hypothetical protein
MWTVNLLVLSSALIVLSLQKTALSESSDLIEITPADLLCYMQSNDGQMINLAQLCGVNNNGVVTSNLSTNDQQFLENYKVFLRRRIGSSPLIDDALSQAQQSPENVVKRAKGICASIKTGTPESIQQISGNVDADLINLMAVEYYCPELDD